MAKRPWWYFNAARRMLLTALPALARPDDEWAASHLSGGEFELFAQLTPAERSHGIEVAKRVLTVRPHASSTLVRAALLHDVGKLGSSDGALLRVLAHLLPLARVAAEPRLTGLAGARQARAHHAAFGERLVLAASGDRAVARLVAAHHAPGADDEARLLHACDELT